MWFARASRALLVSPVQYGRQLELDKAGMGESLPNSPPWPQNTTLASPQQRGTKGIATMTRSLGRKLLLAAFWLLATGTVQAGDCFSCKQWMGCGYGPGYNAPVPPGGGCCANNG